MSRLSNMLTANGYTSFKPYVDEIISGQNRDMVTSMLNKLTTNYTYFMREEAHFNYLKDTVLPNLARAHERDRVLSIWSAGCSSGEEPYTISMYPVSYTQLDVYKRQGLSLCPEAASSSGLKAELADQVFKDLGLA